MDDLIRANALLISEEDEMGDVFDEDDADGAENPAGADNESDDADMSSWEN